MKQRWLVVIIGLPALLAVLLACPAWATMLVVCGIAGIAAYELLHTAGKDVPMSVYVLTIASAAAHEVLLYYREWTFFGTLETVTVLRWAFVMLLFLIAVHRFGGEEPLTFSTLCVAVVGGIVFPTLYSAIALLRAAQANALLSGRDYVLPDDIRRMALPVMSHRLVLSPEARMKGAQPGQILSQLIASVPVPTGGRV